MMNKRFFVNASGILLAFAIAFGGIFAVWSRLDAERDSLLSGGGDVEIPVRIESMETLDMTAVEVKTENLTQAQLRQALLCLESASEKYTHEPTAGQLSMTEAAQRGMVWIKDFFLPRLNQETIPKEYRMSCYLWAGEAGAAGEAGDDLLGYWEVSVTAEEMEAVLVLNAVTGQVLRAWVALPFSAGEHPGDDSLSELLEDYVDSFGIETDHVISIAEAGETGDSKQKPERYGAGESGPAGGDAGSSEPAGGDSGDRDMMGGATGSSEPAGGDSGSHNTMGGATGSGEPAGGDSGDRDTMGGAAGSGEPAGGNSGDRDSMEAGSGSHGTGSPRAGWGFLQRLGNDQVVARLEAGDAVSAQARLTDSGEMLCFALYWETREPID